MYRILLILAFFLSSPALAQNTDDAPFKDWIVLADYLRSNNINPVQVSWNVIEPICLPLKTRDSEVAYNRCKFEKASWEHDFNVDSDSCKTIAETDFPDSLRNPVTRSIVNTDNTGKERTAQEVIPGYTAQQLRESRKGALTKCMMDLNWHSTKDWTMGKRQD